MKTWYRILLFLICMHMACYVVNYCYGLEGLELENVEPLVPPEQLISEFNATATASRWSGFSGLFYQVGDVVSGLIMAINGAKNFLISFPQFLYALGAPAPIVLIVIAVENFVVWWAVIEFISGRRATQ